MFPPFWNVAITGARIAFAPNKTVPPIAGNGVIIDNGGAKVGDGPISLRTKGGHPDTGLSIRHQGGTFTILRVDNLN